MSYHLRTNPVGSPSIIRDSDGAVIPEDAANRDHQDYTEWRKINTPQEQPIPPFQPS